MKLRIIGAIAFALSSVAAHAVVIKGTFAGTVTSGYASGSFGFGGDYLHTTDLTGKAISGTFSIDLSIVQGPCADSGVWNGAYYNACYVADRGVHITQTIDGHEEVFDLARSDTPNPGWDYNLSEAGAFLSNLQSDLIVISTHAHIGDGYGHDERYAMVERKAGIAALLPMGTIADPGDLAGLHYAGAAQTAQGGYTFPGATIWGNDTWIFARDDVNGITADTMFSYAIDSFSIGDVPEPATWMMMISGMGLVGASMRYRRRASAVCVA